MTQMQREITLKERYKDDRIMSRLLECAHDIACINHTLKHYGSPDFTLEEIGLVLGVTRERVRQIESSALKKIRNPKMGRMLRDYVYL